MNPEVSKLLADIAAKLGTTIEYLWPKLVGHAQAVATTHFYVWMIGGVALAIIAIALLAPAFLADDDKFETCMASIVFIGLSLCCAFGAADNYANKKFPEAAALQELVKR
jgi:hypothetical protein